MNEHYALIRGWRALGFETGAQWRAAKVPLKVQEVKEDEQ